MLYSLQYARALAALFVVYSHLSGFEYFRPLANPAVGGFGVDIFFVISGFIMWHTARDMPPVTFAAKRIIRIVPVYWFYTLLLVGIALSLPKLTPNVFVNSEFVIKSLLFLPYENAAGAIQPLLLQGWTLNFEMFFYAVFTAALFVSPLKTRFITVLTILATAILLGACFAVEGPILKTYSDSILLEFIFGMVLAAYPRIYQVQAAVCCVFLILALTLLILASLHTVVAPRAIIVGLPAALLVAGLLGLEDIFQARPNHTMRLVGDASYSLYLSHPFVLSAVAVVARKVKESQIITGDLMPALLFGAVAVVLCVVVSILSFKLIEIPVSRLLAKYVPAR